MLVERLGLLQPGDAWLLALGLFGGVADELPSVCYIAGSIGPFDILVLAYLGRWLLHSTRRIDKSALALWFPFIVLAIFAYVGEINGALHFDLTSWASVLAPLRYLYYPTLFFTATPLLRQPRQLRTLFLGYIGGVLILCVLAVFRSTDPTYFFGLPVLYNPNVVGNFISYAFISLGFAFMPRAPLAKGTLIAALFGFAMFTFSKATWILSVLGLYINALRIKLWQLSLLALVLVGAFFAFTDWAHILGLLATAIDIKLAAAVGDDTEAGSFFVRFSFLITCIYALYDYPLGVGLKNFWPLNHMYAHVHTMFFDSQSPHQALGYMIVQAGWVGLILFGVILYRAIEALFVLYNAPRLGIKAGLIGMILISVMFQIEFMTQPFIYLVFAAACARRKQLAQGI